jgi:hypothetical protein
MNDLIKLFHIYTSERYDVLSKSLPKEIINTHSIMNRIISQYLTNKHNYNNLKQLIDVPRKKISGGASNLNQNYAIVMLCMLKDMYVVGACISAYTHKYLIQKQNRSIKLVVMCDDYIYHKWQTLLKDFFDDIKLIKLIKFGEKNDYNFPKKKYDWMQYSPNKWQCMNFIEYDKILFCDIDMLPVSVNFYDMFDFDTPSIHIIYSFMDKEEKTRMTNQCQSNKMYEIENTFSSYDEYISQHTRPLGSMDGGLILLKPSATMHDEYFDFVKDIYKNGVFSIFNSGPDETSLFYFLTKKGNVYNICNQYLVIPWEDTADKINSAYAYNFLSFVKPWIKHRLLQWKEESLWADIYDVIINNNPYVDQLRELNNEEIKKNIENFKQLNKNEKHKYYYDGNFDKIYNTDTQSIMSLPLESNHDYGVLNIKDLATIVKI